MKRNLVIATLTAAVLVGGGTAVAFADGGDDAPATQDTKIAQNTSKDDDGDDDRDDRADDNRDDRDDQNDRDDRDDRDDQARSADVTAVQALDAALKAQPGTAVQADLDSDDGSRAWEVDVLGKDSVTYTVRVDASSGKILGTETDSEQDDAAEWRTALKDARVDARQAAEAVAGKGFVTSVELDDDERGEGWQVETATGKGGDDDRDWNVDAQTGKVTADRDDDGDDRDDRGDDHDDTNDDRDDHDDRGDDN